MLKISGANRTEQLNAIEAIKDFVRKVNTATSQAFIDYQQDDDGCATLLLHVVGPKADETKSLTDFHEQLKRVTAEVEALLPKAPASAKPSRKAKATEPAGKEKEDAVSDESIPTE